LVGFYGLMFLFAPRFARARYFIMAAGFCFVVGAESLYYGIVAGDPLLRFRIVLSAADLPAPIGPGTGNITGNRWLGPLTSLLVNNEFGVLFWLALPAGWRLMKMRASSRSQVYDFTITLLLLGGVWFVLVGYVLGLRALPRYFFVPAVAAVLLVATWLGFEWKQGHKRLVLLSTALYSVIGLGLIDLSNQQLLLPERTLARLVKTGAYSDLYTDPRTAERAEYLLRWDHIDANRIHSSPPQPGDVFLYAAQAVEFGRAGQNRSFSPEAYRPAAGWMRIATFRGEPTITGRLLQFAGLQGAVERMGLSRLIWETKLTVLYRVTPASAR
jgi:hypothetical protein